jgi:FKBP-type peptidyl-prolyl cis-trans isomerase 2
MNKRNLVLAVCLAGSSVFCQETVETVKKESEKIVSEKDITSEVEAQEASKTEETRKVGSGDKVEVHYTGKLEDGTKFDSSHDRGKTLGFTVGAGQMIKGFDAGVVGMSVGETKTIKMSPEDGYGQPRKELIFVANKSQFPDLGETAISVGQKFNSSNGQAVVTKIDGDNITMDANHHLAGKSLIFEVEMVEIA